MKKRSVASVVALLIFALTFTGCGNGKEEAFSDIVDSSPYFEEEKEEESILLPTIYITTEKGVEMPIDKNEVRCAVGLEDQSKDYIFSDIPAYVHYRGNGSLAVAEKFGKYPYKLEFDNKENPFDLGTDPDRDWVLIPNRGDRTMLRNYAAKRLGELLDGITCSPKFMAVHLFVNGEYEGVYELTEQIEAAKGRVPVDDSFETDQNGFLIELDRYAKDSAGDETTFQVGKNYYTVKSKVANSAQLTFLEDYINKVEKAVYAGDEKAFCELVDINSAVDMYLLQEFSKNIDAGFSSFYMYKNIGEKMYFSPPWDFDLAFGNDIRLDEGSPEGLYIAEGRKNFVQNHLWYIELCKNNWFLDRVKARWKEISNSQITTLISDVETMAEYLSDGMEANFRRWPEFSERLHQEPEHTLEFTTYKEHTDYLIGWMKERKAFLDSIYG